MPTPFGIAKTACRLLVGIVPLLWASGCTLDYLQVLCDCSPAATPQAQHQKNLRGHQQGHCHLADSRRQRLGDFRRRQQSGRVSLRTHLLEQRQP